MITPERIQRLKEERRRYDTTDLRRILDAAETLSTEAHHRLAKAKGSTLACPFPDCVLSAAEHHRLAYGLLADNRDLRRRLAALENGVSES